MICFSKDNSNIKSRSLFIVLMIFAITFCMTFDAYAAVGSGEEFEGPVYEDTVEDTDQDAAND